MRVGDIACDDHVVPLVIVQWVVTVPLQQTWPIPQVEHIVDEPAREGAGDEQIRVCSSLFRKEKTREISEMEQITFRIRN